MLVSPEPEGEQKATKYKTRNRIKYVLLQVSGGSVTGGRRSRNGTVLWPDEMMFMG